MEKGGLFSAGFQEVSSFMIATKIIAYQHSDTLAITGFVLKMTDRLAVRQDGLLAPLQALD
ncbi:MAG: hypothetical protein ABIV07_00775 [Polaromonas sp.]